ncbi:hypothetical protein H6761_02910 [Candidatus Nomurabacteria bacterium]|nr:hypothetical protein [Candidatus Nomurabacteria bacterium]
MNAQDLFRRPVGIFKEDPPKITSRAVVWIPNGVVLFFWLNFCLWAKYSIILSISMALVSVTIFSLFCAFLIKSNGIVMPAFSTAFFGSLVASATALFFASQTAIASSIMIFALMFGATAILSTEKYIWIDDRKVIIRSVITAEFIAITAPMLYILLK